MYLILTTLLHLGSILPLIRYDSRPIRLYCIIIVFSTHFSILYHFYEESHPIITMIDYLFAFIWFLSDLSLAYLYPFQQLMIKVVTGNSIVFIINLLIPHNSMYVIYHSIWHIINSYKCFYISSCIHKNQAGIGTQAMGLF